MGWTDFANLSRRGFVCALAAAPAARLMCAAQGRAERRTIAERRVYDRAGVIPPASILGRCGFGRYHRHDGAERVTFQFRFRSSLERARAWDRFNTDPEWLALREQGAVELEEISFPQGSRIL
jgi:hypothetical protein